MKVKLIDSFLDMCQTTVDFFRKGLPNFIKNVWKFRKGLWNHHWWEYSGGLELLQTALIDIADGIELRGNELKSSSDKKVKAMRRSIEILENVKLDRYLEMAESELGEITRTPISFVKLEGTPERFTLEDKTSTEETQHTLKVLNRAEEVQDAEWSELWRIIRGQDSKALDPENDQDSQFDGSDMRSWWD
jgi:hypothetical protein